jgi:DNA repair exonuclease SbcCD ATPase subunit
MLRRNLALFILSAGLIFTVSSARAANPAAQKKEYLTESEADKIREAVEPGERIKLYISFAEDRLKKFQYELTRQTPDRRRGEMLNSLLNDYAGCIDDATDQIGLAREKQADIRASLKIFKSKGKDFSDALQKLDQGGAEFDTYKDTLEDAIESTKDALTDVDEAQKELPPAPVRRKPS